MIVAGDNPDPQDLMGMLPNEIVLHLLKHADYKTARGLSCIDRRLRSIYHKFKSQLRRFHCKMTITADLNDIKANPEICISGEDYYRRIRFTDKSHPLKRARKESIFDDLNMSADELFFGRHKTITIVGRNKTKAFFCFIEELPQDFVVTEVQFKNCAFDERLANRFPVKRLAGLYLLSLSKGYFNFESSLSWHTFLKALSPRMAKYDALELRHFRDTRNYWKMSSTVSFKEKKIEYTEMAHIGEGPSQIFDASGLNIHEVQFLLSYRTVIINSFIESMVIPMRWVSNIFVGYWVTGRKVIERWSFTIDSHSALQQFYLVIGLDENNEIVNELGARLRFTRHRGNSRRFDCALILRDYSTVKMECDQFDFEESMEE